MEKNATEFRIFFSWHRSIEILLSFSKRQNIKISILPERVCLIQFDFYFGSVCLAFLRGSRVHQNYLLIFISCLSAKIFCFQSQAGDTSIPHQTRIIWIVKSYLLWSIFIRTLLLSPLNSITNLWFKKIKDQNNSLLANSFWGVNNTFGKSLIFQTKIESNTKAV